MQRYGQLFTDFMNSSELPGSAMFQDTFTGRSGRTHYIAISGPSVDSLRETTSTSLSSQAGQNFQRVASNLRKITSTY